MTATLPDEGKSVLIRPRAIVAMATACVMLAISSASLAREPPTLRSGLWKIERTLETNGQATDRRQTSGLLFERETTRCVNPNGALRSLLTPLIPGICSTRDLRKTDEGYF